MVTTLRRGRAAGYGRPGIFIKDMLSAKVPNEDGRFVTEAAVVDVHRAYKRYVREHMLIVGKRTRPMVYSSFITLFRFAHELKLVEMVRKEDMLYPPPTGHLYTAGRHDGIHIETSTRHIYRLTDVGKQDDLSWTNLTRAYIEHWVVPQKLPEVAVAVEYKFSPTPFRGHLIALLEHLKALQKTGFKKEELDRLGMQTGDWVIYYEDRLRVSKEKGIYQPLLDKANRLSEQLIVLDIQGAINTLADMITLTR